MTWNPTSPITGAAQTGFTSPTYTLTADSAPDVNGKQHAVTALGGTQSGVISNSISMPFTLTWWRPKVLKTNGAMNPSTGLLLGSVPRNVFKLITRKGVSIVGGQAQTLIITTTIEVPAGADTSDPANVRAALSAHIGGLSQQSAGVGDASVTGIS